eukprot:5157931-Pleurochrysis_carterae.AAC.1
MKHRKDRVESAQVNRRRGLDLRTETRPNRGQNQAKPMLPMTTLSTRRRNLTAIPPQGCDMYLPPRVSRPIRDGTCVYAESLKSDFRYLPRHENSAS